MRKARWPLIVLGVLLLGLGTMVVLRDQILTRVAHQKADELGQRIGRTIHVGSLHTTLGLSGGARIEDISIGPSKDETEPMLRVHHIDVSALLWPLVRSRGKELPIEHFEVGGVVVSVVRNSEGSTNWQEMLEQLFPAQAGPTTGSGQASAEPTPDLSGLRVEHAALLNGEVHWRDAQHVLQVRRIEGHVDGLRRGNILVATLSAALLADAPNLMVKMTTAPIPTSMVPVPETVTLKLSPVDLTPLAPLLGPEVGLRSGQLDADLLVQVGALMSSGKGPTQLKGDVHGSDFSFASSEGGRAVEAAVHLDVSGDVEAGDLELKALRVTLGPAEINGHGAMKRLMSDDPRVEGLEIVGQNLDPALIAQYYPPLKKSLYGSAGPLGLTLRGSGDERHQGIVLGVDLTAMKLVVPGQLTKAAGHPLALHAKLSGAAKGTLSFDGTLDLSGADLRPGGVLNKPPGQTLEVRAQGSYTPPPSAAKSMRGEIALFEIRGLGSPLSGKGSIDGRTFSIALSGGRIDADSILVTKQGPPAPRSEQSEKPSKANAGSSDTGTKASAKGPYEGYRGQVAVQLEALRYKETDFQNIDIALRILNDQISVERMTAGVHGGQVVLDGTSVRIGAHPMPFELKAKASRLDVAALLPRSVPQGLLTGTFTGNVALTGAGFDAASLSKSLSGVIQGNILNGTFKGVDIFSALGGPLAKALPFGAVGLKEGDVTSLGSELPFGLEFAKGQAKLKKPLTVRGERGSIEMSGSIGLDAKLDLFGTVALSPAMVSLLTKGNVTPKEPLPIGFKLQGLAWRPEVTAVDLGPTVRSLLSQGAASTLLNNPQVQEAGRRLEEQAKDKLRRLFGR